MAINLQEDEINWIKRLSRISNNLYLRAALMVIAAENSIVAIDKSNYYSKVELFVFTNKLLAQDSNDLSFLVTSAKKLLDKEKSKAFKEITEDIDKHDLHVDAQRVITAINAFKLNVLDKKSNYYYDWNGLSYFLYEYNDSLSIPNAAPIQWYRLNNSTSIEHVLPQTPSSAYWETAFEKFNCAEKKTIINSLGNLLLLSCGSENSSLKNYSFPVKKEMSVDSRKFAYSYGSRSAREIATEDCWTINEVVSRTEKLIAFMFDRWFKYLSISESDWKNCVEILKNNLPAKLETMEHDSLLQRLKQIDTSDERSKAEDAVKNKNSNYYEEQFLGYINKDLMSIKYNAKKVYCKDWFTFKIISKNDAPIRLECGVLADGQEYLIYYIYDSNELYVKKKNQEVYLTKIDELPEKLIPFVTSLFRYLRKEFNKPKPEAWKEREM